MFLYPRGCGTKVSPDKFRDVATINVQIDYKNLLSDPDIELRDIVDPKLQRPNEF